LHRRFDVVATLLGRDRRHIGDLFGTTLPSIRESPTFTDA